MRDFIPFLKRRSWIRILLSASIVCLPKYKAFCEKNDPSSSSFYILEGSIFILSARRKEYNAEIVQACSITKFTQGESFGEAGVLFGTPRYRSI